MNINSIMNTRKWAQKYNLV